MCPSASDSVLVVDARIVDGDGDIHPLPQTRFVPGNGDQGYSATRLRTPPRLSLSVPEFAPILDSFKIVSHAQDTLGGNVVKRFLAWSWHDTVPIVSDTQMVFVPDRRTEGSISGCYLGELTPGVRQGVTKRENAVRFTKRGAVRVAKDYPSAHIEPANDREYAIALAQDPRGQTAMAAQREQERA